MNLGLYIKNRGGNIENAVLALQWHKKWIFYISDNIEESHRYSIESVRNSQRGDIWTGFKNHSFAIQKVLIFPPFTDVHVRLHLKKWLWYIRNSSSGYQRETKKWRTFEVYWPYRLVRQMSWIPWGLKLMFEKVSIFQKQALHLWRRRGWYKHILHSRVKKNKTWCQYVATVDWGKARSNPNVS